MNNETVCRSINNAFFNLSIKFFKRLFFLDQVFFFRIQGNLCRLDIAVESDQHFLFGDLF